MSAFKNFAYIFEMFQHVLQCYAFRENVDCFIYQSLRQFFFQDLHSFLLPWDLSCMPLYASLISSSVSASICLILLTINSGASCLPVLLLAKPFHLISTKNNLLFACFVVHNILRIPCHNVTLIITITRRSAAGCRGRNRSLFLCNNKVRYSTLPTFGNHGKHPSSDYYKQPLLFWMHLSIRIKL